MNPWYKKCLAALRYATYLLLATWGLLELAYRYQWIDFYRTELHSLNPATALQANSGKRRLLLLGDSFSAQPESYVAVLRDSLPDWDVLNAAVPGTGIREAAVIGTDKIARFPPDLLLYQIYVGNDLWDIRKTCDSPRMPRWRNLYWWLSDYSLALRYLNYSLGQYKARVGAAVETRELKRDIPFSPALYSRRERMLLEAEPDLIRNSVLLDGGRDRDLDTWLQQMDRILALLPARTQRVVLLVLPHCAQVNAFYRDNLGALGLEPPDAGIAQAEYPLLARIRQHYVAQPRVRVYSPLPLFQQRDSTGHRLYYENDPHLNPAGQKLLGQALAEWLKGWE